MLSPVLIQMKYTSIEYKYSQGSDDMPREEEITRNLKGLKSERKYWSEKQTNVPERLPKKSNYNMAKQPEPAGSGQLAN